MSILGFSRISSFGKNLIACALVFSSLGSVANAEESGDGFVTYWSPRLSSLIKKIDGGSMSSAEKTAYADMNGWMKANGKLDGITSFSAADKASLRAALSASLAALSDINWGKKAKSSGATKEQIIASINAAASKIEAASSGLSISDAKVKSLLKKYILDGMSGDLRSRKVPYVQKNGWVDVGAPKDVPAEAPAYTVPLDIMSSADAAT